MNTIRKLVATLLNQKLLIVWKKYQRTWVNNLSCFERNGERRLDTSAPLSTS